MLTLLTTGTTVRVLSSSLIARGTAHKLPDKFSVEGCTVSMVAKLPLSASVSSNPKPLCGMAGWLCERVAERRVGAANLSGSKGMAQMLLVLARKDLSEANKVAHRAA